MGIVDLKNEPYHWKRIRQALRRRGLNTDEDEEWEIHGPHSDMNYQIYVGGVYKEANPVVKCTCPTKNAQSIYCKAHRQEFYVALYPKIVYRIDDTDEWYRVEPENRISCI